MTARWLQAVIDIPAESFEEASEFWRTVSESSFGAVHPDHDEFVHLIPPAGDMHLELQRIDDGPAGVHLDVLVEDIAESARRAIDLGAQLVAQPGHAVMKTPGGVQFCLVPFGGESERAPTVEDPVPHAVDQICLDVPAKHFDQDVAFWSSFTGWEPNPQVLDEFRSFDQPRLAIRLLVQRLGNGGLAHSHLDLACGDGIAAVVKRHLALGATVVEAYQYWTVMNDPTGMTYCLTHRQP